MMPDLSIIIPTCNRADLLDRCLVKIAENTDCDFEIIVVDGASADHTAAVLSHARQYLGDRLRCIIEDQREGFVRAANKGFRVARGKHLTWLNDDARPLPGAYTNAIAQLAASPSDTGLIALYHRWHSPRNIAFEKSPAQASPPYQLCHVRGTLYANFALGRREIFNRLGYFDERFIFYAADPDLSLKAWNAGFLVIPAESSFIDHDEHSDARRSSDAEQGARDNAKLFAKWDLPPINQKQNDFDADRPCTLRGLRGAIAA
jgi:GT2 family glycosyltransferase